MPLRNDRSYKPICNWLLVVLALAMIKIDFNE